LFFTTSAFALDSDHFVIKVTTTTNSETFNFYTEDGSFDIDWDGDGVFDTIDVSMLWIPQELMCLLLVQCSMSIQARAHTPYGLET
jgi:hypothetical protein